MCVIFTDDGTQTFKGQRCQLLTLGHPSLAYIFNI